MTTVGQEISEYREMADESNLSTANITTDMTDVGRCSIGNRQWDFFATSSSGHSFLDAVEFNDDTSIKHP